MVLKGQFILVQLRDVVGFLDESNAWKVMVISSCKLTVDLSLCNATEIHCLPLIVFFFIKDLALDVGYPG
jgi:hypothetical protein